MVVNAEIRKLRTQIVELKSRIEHLVRNSQELHAQLGGAMRRASQAEHDLAFLKRQHTADLEELNHLHRQEAARQIAGAIEET